MADEKCPKCGTGDYRGSTPHHVPDSIWCLHRQLTAMKLENADLKTRLIESKVQLRTERDDLRYEYRRLAQERDAWRKIAKEREGSMTAVEQIRTVCDIALKAAREAAEDGENLAAKRCPDWPIKPGAEGKEQGKAPDLLAPPEMTIEVRGSEAANQEQP